MTKLILVADHSKTMRKAIQMTLQSPEHQFVEAADGQTALLLAREKKPSLIIAEDLLPGMDGYTLLSAIKHESALSVIPVLILRSKGKPFDAVRGVGAEGHLEKPFLPDTLLELESRAYKARKTAPAEEAVVIEIDAEAPEDDDSMAIVLDFGPPATAPGPIPARTPSAPSIPVISSRELERKPTGSQAASEEAAPKKKETVFLSSFAPPSSAVPAAGASPFTAPAAPVKPAVPVAPAAPAVPVAPAAPAKPAIPVAPAAPAVPVAPAAPAKPAIPVAPAAPAKPAVPVAPAAPAKPAVPVAPAAPAKPAVPAAPPAAPVAPTVSAKPAVPVAPAAPAKPAVPVAPAASADSRPSAKPVVPATPVMPAVPVAPAAAAPADSKPIEVSAPAVSAAVEKAVSAVSAASAEHAALAGLSREIIERIAWEVIPPLAEVIIKEYLQQHPEWIRK